MVNQVSGGSPVPSNEGKPPAIKKSTSLTSFSAQTGPVAEGEENHDLFSGVSVQQEREQDKIAENLSKGGNKLQGRLKKTASLPNLGTIGKAMSRVFNRSKSLSSLEAGPREVGENL